MLDAWDDGFHDGRCAIPRRPPAATRQIRTQYSLGWFAGHEERKARGEAAEEWAPSARAALEGATAVRARERAETKRKVARREPARREARDADEFIADWRRGRG